MARDGAGVYSLPEPPVVSGTAVESNWANTTMDDIAAALTDSLDRNGLGGMLAPFKFSDGSVSAPGSSWTNAPNSGWYRAGTDDFRFSVSGTDLFRLQGGMAQLYVGGDWKSMSYEGGPSTLPAGIADGQTLKYDLTTDRWLATAQLLLTDAGDIAVFGNMLIGGDLTVDGTITGDGSGITGIVGNVPAGGTAAQVLAKIDGTDYNTEWVDQTGGGGAVVSVFGRTDVVVADVADYSAFYLGIGDNAVSATTATTAGTATNLSRSVATAATSGLQGGGTLSSDLNLSLKLNGTTLLKNSSGLYVNSAVIPELAGNNTFTASNTFTSTNNAIEGLDITGSPFPLTLSGIAPGAVHYLKVTAAGVVFTSAT